MPSYIFVDESGDAVVNPDNRDASEWFILSGIAVEEKDLGEIREKVDDIREKFFPGKEMKCSGLKPERLIMILKALSMIPFGIYLFVVDKRRLSEGFKWKRSFIKNVHFNFYRSIAGLSGPIRVIGDEHGSPEFMLSFKDYLTRKARELFDPEVEQRSSTSEVLIQLADIIAGSVLRVCREPESEQAYQFRGLFRGRVIRETHFPPVPRNDKIRESDPNSRDYDEEVFSDNFLKAGNLRDSLDVESDFAMARISVLDFLMDQALSEPASYVSMTELRRHIRQTEQSSSISEQIFRSEVIGKIRDAGVIIASSEKGYKLPTGIADIFSYVSRCDHVISPMVARLDLARCTVKAISCGNIDILEDHPQLHKHGTLIV